MSDGWFDIDNFIKHRRENENLFDMTINPFTGVKSTYPCVTKISTTHTDQHSNNDDKNRCKMCNYVNNCKLVEQGFFELCRQNL